MNAWTDWLNNKIQTHTLPDFPDYFQKVLAEHGMPDHTKACKGCKHLSKRTSKIPGYDPLGNKIQTEVVSYRCTAWGGAHDWRPEWPACGTKDKEIKKKGGKP